MFFKRNTVPEIDATALHGLLKSDPAPRLLDVREPDEHAEGIIRGAHLIPMRQLGTKLNEVAPNPDEAIVVYCHSGSRSAHVAGQMIKAGYSNVQSLRGGILSWFRQGYEIKQP